VANLTIDTHLMVTHPSKLFDAFQKAGSEWITVHVECEENIHELLKNIKARGIKCGLSLKPGTPIEHLEPYLQDLDLVLVMTVEPGFGGQSFMENMVKKVAWLHTQRTEGKGDYLIEVDGGINVETGGLCAAAGADVLVSGSYLYGSKERSSNIKAMKQLPHPSSTQAD
jgi:ribulose-phosphate 3-epimerase